MISGGSEHTLARAIMEHFHPTTFPESLKATLNCYQLSSIDSLSGPSGFPALAAQMWFKENKQLPPIPPQPMVQIPYFIPNDKSAKRSETCLAGEKIACFIVGGEKRLCLPQILTSVLREYSIAEINQACADLHIYCSRCLPKQLETLKVLGILPINTAQCGLITKTDAERLVALLTDQHEPVKSHRDRLPKHIDPDSGIEVYHECFGRGYGKIYPELYNSPIAPCIVCEGCGCMYSPQRFITHSHRSFEKRTCHWGFDPDSWRNYLLLPKDLEGAKREEYQKILDQVKSRFEQRYDVPSHPPVRYSGGSPTPSKRRYDSEQESPIRKKIKEEDTKIFDPALLPHPYASLQYGVPSAMRHSAFRPWSPGLATAMSGGPNPGDIPVVQEIPQHLKGLLPITFDRRGFSQFIQNERPVVIGSSSSRASDFPIAPPDGRPVPSIGIPPSSERKKSADIEKSNPAKICLKSPTRDSAAEKDKNNNHCADPVSGLSNRNLPKVSMTRKYSIDRSPHERPRKLSTSPSRHHPNVAEVRPRSRQRHTSPVPYREQIPVTPNSSQRAPTTSTSYSHSSNNNNMLLKEPKEEYEIARPISRSREAAATAMLELKSSGLYRSVAPPPPLARHSPPPTPVSETPTKVVSTSKSVPSIVPLDSTKQQYKWMIAGHSYVISAAGIQSLEATRSIVGSECGNEAARNRIMHEFVKMKSLFEEKFDIEMRVRRDLELELEHLKASKREKIQATSEKRKQINEEMDIMRQEHSRRMKELSKSQEMFLSKLKDQGRDSQVASAIKNDQDLRARIHELEMKNDKLRLDLMDEREKRTDAELKQKEATESSRGRISFLLSPLSRMVRGVAGRKAADEESSITSSCTNKNISSTQVPSFPSVSSITSTSSHQRQLNGILSPTAPPVNCLPHEQSISSDVESQKPVIVS
ncbi:uncharacterized protein LOC120327575 isoform X2 [Styela clava]